MVIIIIIIIIIIVIIIIVIISKSEKNFAFAETPEKLKIGVPFPPPLGTFVLPLHSIVSTRGICGE